MKQIIGKIKQGRQAVKISSLFFFALCLFMTIKIKTEINVFKVEKGESMGSHFTFTLATFS